MPQGCQFAYSSGSNRLPIGSAVPAPASSHLMSTTSTVMSRESSIARLHGRQASAHSHAPQIEDLCGALASRERTVAGGCFGFITGDTSELFLSHKSCGPSSSTVITLRDILAGDDSRFPEFDYVHKVRIAYALSSSLLPLSTTPWLQKVLNIDNIAFMGEKGLGAYVYYLDRPFLTKELAIYPSTAGANCGHQPSQWLVKPRIFTILSLVLVLVQTMLGRGMEELEVAEQSCMSCLLDQQAVATQKAGTVLAKGGDMYADAVNWCLKNFLSRATEDEEAFSQQYYDTVVAKLEGIIEL